jgi:hypothetical protein
MHGWLQCELGGSARVKEQKVVCVSHLPGINEVMRMETASDLSERKPVVNTMSATRRNCVAAGLEIDPRSVEQEYGLTQQQLDLFVPIECPSTCMNAEGLLRPWSLDTCLGKEQATALQRLLRQEFWKGVERFNAEYARRVGSKSYPAVEMIEAFCLETRTPDLYADAMRREWQRRVKREKEKST